MSNPIDELLKGMAAHKSGPMRKPDWRDRMVEAIEQLDSDNSALLIVRRAGKLRLIRSTHGTAREMLEKAAAALPKTNIK